MKGPCIRDGGEIVGVEIRGFYDGLAYWQCSRCNQVWDRQDRAHATVDTVPHPTRRLLTVGEWRVSVKAIEERDPLAADLAKAR